MIQDLYVTNNAVHHYATRQNNLLHVPPGVHTNNFRHKSILIWNKLSTLGISFDIPISRFKYTTKDLLQHSVLNVGYLKKTLLYVQINPYKRVILMLIRYFS